VTGQRSTSAQHSPGLIDTSLGGGCVRAWNWWMLVGLLVQSWACSPTCKTGEVRAGDRCVARADVAKDDAEAATPDETDEGEEGGAETQSSTHSDSGGNPLDGAGNQSGDAGGSTTDAISSVDAIVGIEPNDAGPSNGEGGCVGAACVVDACHPNPCGHGTCTHAGGGFNCTCEQDWRADGTGRCNVNVNAALSGLAVSAGHLYPAFKSTTYQYSVDLPLGAPEVTVTPSVAIPDGAAVRVNEESQPSGEATGLFPIELNKEFRVEVQVTANGGAVRTYSIVFRRTLVLQATIKDLRRTHIEMFGRELMLNGNLLVASSIVSDSSEAEGPRTTTFSIYRRNGVSWDLLSYLASVNGDTGSVALGDDWLAVARGPGQVIVHKRSEIGPNTAPWAYSLVADPGETGFGSKVAVAGNLAVVASTSMLHIYELGTWAEDNKPLQTRLPLNDRRYTPKWLSIEGDWVVASSAGNSTPAIYHRDTSGWKATAWPGKTATSDHSVTFFGGEIAYVEHYACVFGCIGTVPELEIFSSGASGWIRSSVRLPAKPDVPQAQDPNGFGMGLAQGPNLVLVGAPLVGSLRPPISRMSDPFVSLGEERPTALYGSAYIFVRKQAGWVADAILSPVGESAAESQPVLMGASASYSNGLLAVAAPAHGDGLSPTWRTDYFSGAIYIYGPDCTKVPAGAQVPGC
jgi:hypothetical protein